MKTRIVCAFIAALSLCLVSCSGSSGSKDRPNDYGYRYPTNCLGDGAVWWTLHENRICEKPYVKIKDEEGYIFADYTVKLDLRDCGFMAINDYFGQIEAAGYTMLDSDELSEWLNPTKKEQHTYFFKEADPIGFNYANTWRIQLHGNGTLDDNPSLTITYLYEHLPS